MLTNLIVPAATVPRAKKSTNLGKVPGTGGDRLPARWIPWADLLRRIFLVDALQCNRCAGRMKILAVVRNRDATRAILANLGLSHDPPYIEPARPPPQTDIGFDTPPPEEFPDPPPPAEA